MNAESVRTGFLEGTQEEIAGFLAQPEVAAVLKLARRRHFRKDPAWISERLLWDVDPDYMALVVSELDQAGLLDDPGGHELVLAEARKRALTLDGDDTDIHIGAHIRHLRLLAGLSPGVPVYQWKRGIHLSPLSINRFGANLVEYWGRAFSRMNSNVHGRLLHVHACALPKVTEADGDPAGDMADALEAGVGRRGFGYVRFFQLFSADGLTKIGRSLTDEFWHAERYLCERPLSGNYPYVFSFSAAYVST